MSLILTPKVKAVVVNDSETTYPHECCGFLYGDDKGNYRVLTYSEEVHNTREENRERRFEISGKDYMKAEQYADEHGLTLLGVYHSHPDHPAVPSEYDLRHALPYFSYIIASVKKGKVEVIRSWKLNEEGRFEEEQVIETDTDDIDIKTLLHQISTNNG